MSEPAVMEEETSELDEKIEILNTALAGVAMLVDKSDLSEDEVEALNDKMMEVGEEAGRILNRDDLPEETQLQLLSELIEDLSGVAGELMDQNAQRGFGSMLSDIDGLASTFDEAAGDDDMGDLDDLEEAPFVSGKLANKHVIDMPVKKLKK